MKQNNSPLPMFKDYAEIPAYHMSAQQIAPFDLQANTDKPEIVISIPHGGFYYPDKIVPNNYKYLDRMRSLEDSGTSLLKDLMPFDKSAIISATLSRALIDLNRPPTALDPLLYEEAIKQPAPTERFTRYIQAGYGVSPRLCAHKQPLYDKKIALKDTQALTSSFYEPYHKKLASLLTQGVQHHGQILLIDLHSMPSIYAGKTCPDFVFGDHFGRTLPAPYRDIITNIMKQTDFSFGWNHPYAGGYITTHYGDMQGPVHAVQIEINRALYCKPGNKVSCEALQMIAQIIMKLAGALQDQMPAHLAAE